MSPPASAALPSAAELSATSRIIRTPKPRSCPQETQLASGVPNESGFGRVLSHRWAVTDRRGTDGRPPPTLRRLSPTGDVRVRPLCAQRGPVRTHVASLQHALNRPGCLSRRYALAGQGLGHPWPLAGRGPGRHRGLSAGASRDRQSNRHKQAAPRSPCAKRPTLSIPSDKPRPKPPRLCALTNLEAEKAGDRQPRNRLLQDLAN